MSFIHGSITEPTALIKPAPTRVRVKNYSLHKDAKKANQDEEGGERATVSLSEEEKKIYGDRFIEGYKKIKLLGK